jgi:hypothetical protein
MLFHTSIVKATAHSQITHHLPAGKAQLFFKCSRKLYVVLNRQKNEENNLSDIRICRSCIQLQ